LKRVLLVAVSLTILAITSKAGLGWTLDECKKHYGEPTSTETHALGLKKLTFLVKDFYVVVQTDNKGKVGLITYTRPSIDEVLVKQLMEQNAPKVLWTPYQISEPECQAWTGSEKGTPAKKGSTPQYLTIFKKSSGLSSDRASVAIGTLDFHNFEKASKKQEAKDQASGL
jgi:hypothetical protein